MDCGTRSDGILNEIHGIWKEKVENAWEKGWEDMWEICFSGFVDVATF